jgi:hypothetical protein
MNAFVIQGKDTKIEGTRITVRADLSVLFNDEYECLLFLLAHEFRHAWQEEHGMAAFRKAHTIASTIFTDHYIDNEVDADRYAVKRLRAWRKSR